MCSCDCLDREVGPDAPLRSLPARLILCLCDRSRERRGSAMATLTAPLPSGRFRREPRSGTGPAPLREIQAGKAALSSGLLRHPPRSAAEERPGVTPSSRAGPGLRGGIVRHPRTGPNRVTSLIPSPGYPLISRPDEEHRCPSWKAPCRGEPSPWAQAGVSGRNSYSISRDCRSQRREGLGGVPWQSCGRTLCTVGQKDQSG